ncbi:germin-like protein 3-8 [Canna indica]|uniref:Germin-like protein n=1 Tax=Canna indica TaxID=4628 RepID=A0AAQ3K925_9LILI|nr:germin-like protein 3-8 [Canna indica]
MALQSTPKPLPLLLSLSLLASAFSDPDPLQDFCVADLDSAAGTNGFPCKPLAAVTSDDFFFDGLSTEGDTGNVIGSSVASANVLTFPALNTLGLSMNRVDVAPGGLNPPHSHPHASELILVVEGRLLVGFVGSAGNRFFSKVLGPGENFVVPKGLVHFQYNVGEVKAVAVTAFDSQLPGVVVAAPTLFGATPPIPDEVLAKAFQVDQKTVAMIKSKFER